VTQTAIHPPDSVAGLTEKVEKEEPQKKLGKEKKDKERHGSDWR